MQKQAPKLGLAGGKLSLGASSQGNAVPPSHLHSLRDLLASPYAGQVLGKLRAQGEAVATLIKEEMRHPRFRVFPGDSDGEDGPCGIPWGVRLGFHAVPSMDTVHLHVCIVSANLCSFVFCTADNELTSRKAILFYCR